MMRLLDQMMCQEQDTLQYLNTRKWDVLAEAYIDSKKEAKTRTGISQVGTS